MRGLRRSLAGRSTAAALAAFAALLLSPKPQVLADLALPCPQLLPNVPCPLAPLPPAPQNPVLPHLGPATPAPPTPHPSAAPTPKPPPGPANATGSLTPLGVVEDPALAAQVSEIVTHPVSAERPVLLHFQVAPPRHTAGAVKPAGTGASTSTAALATITALVVVGVVLVSLGMIATSRRRSQRARVREGAAASPGAKPRTAERRRPSTEHLPPMLRFLREAPHRLIGGLRSASLVPVRGAAVLGQGVLAASGGARRVLTARRPQGLAGRRFLRLRSPLGALTPVAILAVAGAVCAATTVVGGNKGSQAVASKPAAERQQMVPAVAASPVVQPTWTQLLSIEREMDNQRQQLATQEDQVAQLSQQLNQQFDQHAEGVKVTPQMPAELARLVAQHQTLVSALDENLQKEFNLFAGVATNPIARDALMTTAQSTGKPDVQAAIAYNLSLIEAELNQEAQIRAAEAAAAVSNPTSTIKHIPGRPTLIGPLGGAIGQCFGPSSFSAEPAVVARGQLYPHFHTGIDIDGPMGAPVHAAADGVVILATSSVDAQGQLNGYGNYVVISHGGGFSTLYAHLQNAVVRAGQHVTQGQVIGHEGSTGNSTGPHVHFETRLNGSAVNPIPYLGGQVKGC